MGPSEHPTSLNISTEEWKQPQSVQQGTIHTPKTLDPLRKRRYPQDKKSPQDFPKRTRFWTTIFKNRNQWAYTIHNNIVGVKLMGAEATSTTNPEKYRSDKSKINVLYST